MTQSVPSCLPRHNQTHPPPLAWETMRVEEAGHPFEGLLRLRFPIRIPDLPQDERRWGGRPLLPLSVHGEGARG